MADDYTSTEKKAIEYLKKNEKLIIQKFASIDLFPPVSKPSTYFMAGSPGAGKTEYSKEFIKELVAKDSQRKIVRIDADEIRDMIPCYDKTNASEIQRAATKGVQVLFDYTQAHSQDVLLDSTFAYADASKNVERALGRKRKVGIFYIYQDPLTAWDFTKKREKLEGRPVPKEFFVKAFFAAKDNVNRVKSKFGKKIELNVIKKKQDNLGIEKAFFNVDNVDSYLKIQYTSQSLEDLLH